MDFRLLGPVEATFDGRPVDLGPPRQRSVLAALLVEVNHLVPVEQLLERVWGDRRPHRANGTLYSYLSRLRNALSSDGDITITRRPGGYQLTADPLSVDLHQFRRLVVLARVGEREDAAELFRQALQLWRGEALAALDTPWFNRIRSALDAERWAVELDRNNLELRHGRHGDLLPELSARSAEHPLDERLVGQLMIALYRSGRQAEALQVYLSTRAALVNELGLEPGPELAELHHQILAADPRLAVAEPLKKGVPAVGIPRQLPVDPIHFAGRERYLADLRALLHGRPAAAVIAAIDGTAGVGKTTLAVHFGHKVADRFPDGQLYLDLRGYAHASPMTTVDALGRMLRSLGLPPERIPGDEQEQAALYRSTLAGKRMLVILDNARSAAQVRSLLPAEPGCLVVVTSRTTLTALDGVQHVHLDVLAKDEAIDLLARLVGGDRVDREPEAAASLVTMCARLPLAVRIAGARLAARPSWAIAALADRLANEKSRLDELQLDDRAVRASFAVTHQALTASPDPIDRRAARMFRLLGVLDWVEMTVPIAAALLDLPMADAHPALERLHDAHLVDSTDPGHYHTHDLLRLYARDAALRDESCADRHAGLRRALDCYLASAEAATLLLTADPHSVGADPARDPHGGFALSTPVDVANWTDAEHANLIAAASQGLGTPEVRARAARLTAALPRLFEARGYSRDLVTVLELAVQTGDQVDRARAGEDLGYVYLRVGRSDDAIRTARNALAGWRELGNRRGESACLRYLGYARYEQKRYDEATDCLLQSLTLCRDIGYRHGEAATLNALGLCYQRSSRFADALGCHRQALAIHRETGNRLGEPSALNNLAWVYHRTGRHDQAIIRYKEALSIARDIGFRYTEAEILWGLGEAHHAVGRSDQARTYWQRAIMILQDVGALTADDAAALRDQPVPGTPEFIERNI